MLRSRMLNRDGIAAGRAVRVQSRHRGYPKAKELLDRLAIIRPAMQQTLDKFGNLPVDIRPIFTTANQVTAR